jgi:asparagine synthase (glutamine-hydrolysing)
MCGILGGISLSGTFFPNSNELQKAASCLKHRGPDGSGQIQFSCGNTNVSFAHTRLSIIDLSELGSQPMTSMSGKTTIVFNGEIYNYKLLREELEGNGFSFYTHSDTEVILNGFECWGIDEILNRLDGMFAFAIFDKERELLFLARDRFGKKPLYYYKEEKRLAFSSDIRSFKSLAGVSLTIDMRALGYFFAELSTPMESTIWQEVKKVKPGTALVFNKGRVQEKEYWQLQYNESCSLSRSDVINETDRLLTQAVNKRLVADVRVGALLSGGIDSSLVVAKMAQLSSQRIRTYSVGFSEDQFNELPFARMVAKKFDTEHTELIISAEQVANMNELIVEYGEPFADSSMLPTYLIAKEVAKTEKVVLGGDGGDELFGGYHAHYFAHQYDRVKRFKDFYGITRFVKGLFPVYQVELLDALLSQANKPAHALLNRQMGFTTGQLQQLCHEPVFFTGLDQEHQLIWKTFSASSKNELINHLAASLRTRLVNDYLVKVDRATMFASLEMRSPFLDKELATFTSSLKPEQILYKGETKSILKELALRYFEKDFVYRNKQGFGIPMGEWFKKKLKQTLLETVLGGKQKLADLNYTFIEKIIHEHLEGKQDHAHRVWSLYVFHIWAQRQ